MAFTTVFPPCAEAVSMDAVMHPSEVACLFLLQSHREVYFLVSNAGPGLDAAFLFDDTCRHAAANCICLHS